MSIVFFWCRIPDLKGQGEGPRGSGSPPNKVKIIISYHQSNINHQSLINKRWSSHDKHRSSKKTINNQKKVQCQCLHHLTVRSVIPRAARQEFSISWQHCCQQFLDGEVNVWPAPGHIGVVLMKPRPNSSTATHTKKNERGCTFCNVQSVRLYGLQLNLRNNRNTETVTEEVIFSNIPKHEFRRIFLSGSVTNIINL